ncbi:flavin reductase [Pusillimonas sp.]|uniref:flavin reductase n=1 Tax=Pusillimonas sp. TaxID=3040095 RepID=UPI0037CA019C
MAKPYETDAKALRQVLASFATGVTIVTTNDTSGEPVGITANSFSSVSLSPPLVLWSLAKSAFSRSAFESNGYWAVHILAHDQEGLSNRFARSGENKFAGLALESGINDLPLIPGCAARLQCKTALQYEGGDHIIFVGEVVQYEAISASPLVFHAGRYAMAVQNAQALSLSKVMKNPSIGHTEDYIGYLLWRAYFQFFAKLRDYLAQQDIAPVEYYLLCALAVHDGRTLEEINEVNVLSGAAATRETVASLREKAFICTRIEGGKVHLHLTEEGYLRSRALMSQARELENEAELAIGAGDTLALKSLLKKLITHTPVGVPHPWDSLPDDQNIESGVA